MLSVIRFPKNKARRAIWLKQCGLLEKDIKHNRKLCCSHFKKDCIITNAKRIILKKNAVPVIFEKEIKLKKSKKRSQILGNTEAMLQNVQVDDFESLAADVKSLEDLFLFTEESSEAILQNVQVDDLESSAANLYPLEDLYQFTEESSENLLIRQLVSETHCRTNHLHNFQ
ncbi:52 kDa repressor of the inhibitor of the protein kinase-like isoform X1 [Aphis gossypii]|uniref:52 kDa repressor of the inhibitor of the protein kinase-like isoform X1 n=1 Tax=Aphis gossypii TaxID=80765 RepID=UPI002158B69D|nr:52 kDa repressor of the inhibitor of the protein kinase-like isoform X1 [Aphis gossypii]